MAASAPLRTGYLVAYNLASAAAWTVVLGRTLAAVVAGLGPAGVHAAVGEWTKWTQTLAVLEVAHALLGIVRAPLATTLMQVASRLLLVWPVVDAFPHLAAPSPAYAAMLAAWATAEVVRYAFFALGLCGCRPPALLWLRYSTFFVLYPVGILSECRLIYAAATAPDGVRSPLAKYALYAVLLVYVPGSYVLFTHMMRQRRRVLGSLRA